MIYGMSTERRRSYSEIESNKLLLRETTWAGLEDVTIGRSRHMGGARGRTVDPQEESRGHRADTLRESGRWMRRGQGSRGRSSWRRDTAPALGARGAGRECGCAKPPSEGQQRPKSWQGCARRHPRTVLSRPVRFITCGFYPRIPRNRIASPLM